MNANTTNKMAEVASIFNKKLNEEFRIKVNYKKMDNPEEISYRAVFTEHGLMTDDYFSSPANILMLLLLGIAEVTEDIADDS